MNNQHRTTRIIFLETTALLVDVTSTVFDREEVQEGMQYALDQAHAILNGDAQEEMEEA